MPPAQEPARLLLPVKPEKRVRQEQGPGRMRAFRADPIFAGCTWADRPQDNARLRDRFDEITVSTSNLTVEHIMPKKWAENWPLSNGAIASHESSFTAMLEGTPMDDATKALVDARSHAVDTMGNLTLITSSLNPSIGNAGWKSKKERLSGSLLALNRLIAKSDVWTEGTIADRAEQIGGVVVTRWTGAEAK